jgi:hypothetical protein
MGWRRSGGGQRLRPRKDMQLKTSKPLNAGGVSAVIYHAVGTPMPLLNARPSEPYWF